MLERYRAPGEVTGKDVVEWAMAGDSLAAAVVTRSGTFLGQGLAILIAGLSNCVCYNPYAISGDICGSLRLFADLE